MIESVPLTDASKSLLQINPDLWVNVYGIHYVSEVVFGASFMGYQCLQQRQEWDSNSLHVFVKVDVSEMFFHAGGSEDFT